MAPAVVRHPGARRKEAKSLSTRTISPAGDPFTSSEAVGQGQDHPHACLNGYVYLGYTYLSEETGDEVEAFERIPCRRCADSR